jgi:hypothetical protein
MFKVKMGSNTAEINKKSLKYLLSRSKQKIITSKNNNEKKKGMKQ